MTATVRQALDEWLVARAPRKDSSHTSLAYRQDVKGISELLAVSLGHDAWDDVSVTELTTGNLRRAFATYAGTHEKASIARAHSTWTGLCRFLVAEGSLPADPMASVARPEVPRGAPKPLSSTRAGGSTEETALALVRWLSGNERGGYDDWPERDRAVITTLLLTGLRSAELRDLNVRDLSGATGERQVTVVGKGDKTRTVPIDHSLDSLLDAYAASRARRLGSPSPSSPLFTDRHGQRMTASQLRYLVKACCRAAGIGDALPRGAAVHSLRHTFASLIAANGATAVEIMQLLGHSDLSTSQRYIDASAREVRSAVESNPLARSLRAAAPG